MDLDLPKLPAVRQQSEQRLRIPPTLSGLHQPPPDAGILPSISIAGPRTVELPERGAPASQRNNRNASDQPTQVSLSTQRWSSDRVGKDGKSSGAVAPTEDGKVPKSKKKNKWSEHETNDLLKGVAAFGIGRWTKILNCEDYRFERRTALDLKDRFRICYPDHYKTNRKSKTKEPSQQAKATHTADTYGASSEEAERSHPSDRKSQAELRDLGIEGSFVNSSRRKRTAYTKAEDDAIWKGFQKHKKAWAAIQNDESLGLASRTPTDLRDRFRTNWPEEYEKAGLKVRAEGIPQSQQREVEEGSSRARPDLSKKNTPSKEDVQTTSNPLKQSSESRTEHTSINTLTQETSKLPSRRTDPTFLHHNDDIFWSLPLDAEGERITLDRGILDWPFEFTKANTITGANTGAIDSLSTLNLPMPTSVTVAGNATSSQTAGTVHATLPSLATITAGSMSIDFGEQLELPSLMTGFGALEGESSDVRTVAQLMSLDELLS